MYRSLLYCASCLALVLCVGAQALSALPLPQTGEAVVPMDRTPVYRVNVVARTTDAVNYRHRAGSTKIDFRGTNLAPQIRGNAQVESKQGRLDVETRLQHFGPANVYGPEYLTYVLWAITPEGRPANLGELIPDKDGKVSIKVTTTLQAFGMIVTAEPYFAVTRPSDLVVAENQIRHDTKGWEQPITARFEALEKGEYSVDLNPAELPANTADRRKVPLELLEAENAVAIARATGAEKYAPDTMAHANAFLTRGQDYLERKQSRSAIGTVARGAAQAAEDARVLTIRRKNEERVAAEKKAEADRAEAAQARAAEESARASEAQEQQQKAEQAQREAEVAAQEAAKAKQEAEAAREAALQQQQALAAQARQAQSAAQQSEQMRTRLLQQLNQVLQTRDTARGLIVNMSDVLFDFNKATLRPGAKLRLAKVAGIIQAYPDLKLQLEGHTDSIGSEEYNQELSEKRAAAVRDFLVQQGVSLNNVSAQGYGKADPIASNTTPEGRQQNRRVDMVVSGEAIGQATTPEGPASTPAMASPNNPPPATPPNDNNQPR